MDKDQTVSLVKAGVGFAGSIGAGIIVNSAVSNQCFNPTPIQKPFIWLAKFAIGGAVSEVVTKQTNQQIDEIVAAIDAYRNKVEAADG